MSQVDEEREATRLSERLAEQKRVEEAKKQSRVQGETAFSKKMAEQGASAQAQQAHQVAQQRAEKDNLGRSAIALLKEQSEAQRSAFAQGDAKGAHQRAGSLATEQRQLAHGSEESRVSQGVEEASAEAGRSAGEGLRASQGADSEQHQGRASDARASNDQLEGRKGESDTNASARSGGRSEKGKVDADQSGGGQKGQGGDQKGSEQAAAGFRLNPALMAPVPVAVKKETSGSERLRKIAAELAQKIVERVRVGTNALGNAEFQIDLRQDVLSGLSVKISAKNGRISALFSSRDREVLKKLEGQEEALKGALGSRGLTLESFKVETRT